MNSKLINYIIGTCVILLIGTIALSFTDLKWISEDEDTTSFTFFIVDFLLLGILTLISIYIYHKNEWVYYLSFILIVLSGLSTGILIFDKLNPVFDGLFVSIFLLSFLFLLLSFNKHIITLRINIIFLTIFLIVKVIFQKSNLLSNFFSVTIFYAFSMVLVLGILFVQIFISFKFLKENFYNGIIFIISSLSLVASFFYLMNSIDEITPLAVSLRSWIILLYLVMSFVLIVGIQFTNFIKWKNETRSFLVHNILVPWFFIFCLGSFSILFPEYYSSFSKTFFDKNQPWKMVDYKLEGE